MCGRYNKISSDDMDADGVVQPNPQDFTYFYAEPECREIVVYEDLCQYQPQLVRPYMTSYCLFPSQWHFFHTSDRKQMRYFIILFFGTILKVAYLHFNYL